MIRRAVALLALSLLLAAPARAQTPRTLEECVEAAVADSGLVGEAQGKVAEWEARLAEVRSTWYPKLTGYAFAAPMFRVSGSPLAPDVDRDWGSWGPYLHFEGLLAQPVYTFGRAAAGEKAARERLEVERARLEQVRGAVALEVHRFYYLHLYAQGMKPTLESTRKILEEAEGKAKELFASASGKVTTVELAKLRYASTELEKYRVQADIGAALSLAALKHTMGVREADALVLADERLPSLSDEPLPTLAELIKTAHDRRPEMVQLRHGREAALSFEQAERLASAPVLALAGQLSASWTPMRPDAKNPYQYDPYNEVTGGVALALQFDVDLAKSKARGDAAKAMSEQLEGLARFAATGIPMEVRKAYDDAVQAQKLAELSNEGATAARKWMLFAAAAYTTGTGETRDLLEGVAANASAKKGYFDALLAAHLARAQLRYATGEIATLPAPKPKPEAPKAER